MSGTPVFTNSQIQIPLLYFPHADALTAARDLLARGRPFGSHTPALITDTLLSKVTRHIEHCCATLSSVRRRAADDGRKEPMSNEKKFVVRSLACKYNRTLHLASALDHLDGPDGRSALGHAHVHLDRSVLLAVLSDATDQRPRRAVALRDDEAS